MKFLFSILIAMMMFACQGEENEACLVTDSLDSTSDLYSVVPINTRNFRCFSIDGIGTYPAPFWSIDSFPQNPKYIQHLNYFGKLNTFYAYRAKGSTALIWIYGDADIDFCFQDITEPTYCTSGKTLEDGQGIGPTESMMDSVLRRELGMLQCQGISRLPDSLLAQVLDSLSSGESLVRERCDYVYIRDGVLDKCGHKYVPMNHVKYYHDPGIPPLPDSLYEQCGF
jgi:hypothetical protein